MLKLSKEIFCQSGSMIRRLTLNQLQNGLAKKFSSSYEGDGKTKVKVLNNDLEMGLMVNSFSEVSLIESQMCISNWIIDNFFFLLAWLSTQ